LTTHSRTPASESGPRRGGPHRPPVGRLTRYFVAGVLFTAPLSITLWLAWLMVSFVDEAVTPLIPPQWQPGTYLPYDIPGTGLVVAALALVIAGWFATSLAGRLLVRTGEAVLSRVPLVRGIYAALKQIFETVLAERATAFRQVVLLEYPYRGCWSLGFLTGTTSGEVQARTTDEVVNVFVPATPNPTTGFLLFVPRHDVTLLDMSVDQGLKLIISGGIVTPSDAPAMAEPLASEGFEPPRRTLGSRLRNYLFAGILVTAPVGLTMWIAWNVVAGIDAWVNELLPDGWNPGVYLPFTVPGLGVVLIVCAIALIGFLTTGLLGRILTGMVERWLAQVPFLHGIYGALKQILETVLSRDSEAFREVCLIEYPRRGLWALGFITGESRGEVQSRTERRLINVFLATTPNPTSGFLLLLPAGDVHPLTMTVEQGLKMVVSGGIVTPPYEAPREAGEAAGQRRTG